jgi:hypothetical protein
MAVREFHVGETVGILLKMKDANGQDTTVYDVAAGIAWELTHQNSMELADDDANPLDQKLTFTSLTPPGEDAAVSVVFDGDPGTGMVEVRAQTTDQIRVVAGPAVSAELAVLEMA